jgi:predicted CoA-binding protein
MSEDWTQRLVEDSPRIRRIAGSARRVAVLGMRSERYPTRPDHYVARYLLKVGIDVRPVPVAESGLSTILGCPVYARVADVPPVVDIAVVFRRSEQVAEHVEDLFAARPRCVWLQSGIRDDVSAERLARAGIFVVQDRCLMVEHRAARAAGLVA